MICHAEGIFGSNVSDEIWGMWRPQGSSSEVAAATELLKLKDASIEKGGSRQGKKGIQLREDVEAAAKAASRAETEDQAAAAMLILQHLLALAQDPRPESFRLAMSAALMCMEKFVGAECCRQGLCTLACIFKTCAAVEGTAAMAVGRSVTEVVDREKGWQVGWL